MTTLVTLADGRPCLQEPPRDRCRCLEVLGLSQRAGNSTGSVMPTQMYVLNQIPAQDSNPSFALAQDRLGFLWWPLGEAGCSPLCSKAMLCITPAGLRAGTERRQKPRKLCCWLGGGAAAPQWLLADCRQSAFSCLLSAGSSLPPFPTWLRALSDCHTMTSAALCLSLHASRPKHGSEFSVPQALLSCLLSTKENYHIWPI